VLHGNERAIDGAKQKNRRPLGGDGRNTTVESKKNEKTRCRFSIKITDNIQRAFLEFQFA
jgi:hypothetical protein